VIDSRTAIECKGAEKLLDRGDMLFRTKDKTQPIRVQGCFISDNDTEAAIKTAIEKYGEALYDAGLLLDVEYAANKYFTNTSEDPTDDEDEDDDDSYLHDPQFLSAVDIAIQSGKVSTSLLQRKLYIGYGKAAVFIDTMEELGIISEQDGMKPRDVLISKSEWEKKLENL
jgi:S-DNA-T family DNA segregation ATPase FtsK/SpoIIIE